MWLYGIDEKGQVVGWAEQSGSEYHGVIRFADVRGDLPTIHAAMADAGAVKCFRATEPLHLIAGTIIA